MMLAGATLNKKCKVMLRGDGQMQSVQPIQPRLMSSRSSWNSKPQTPLSQGLSLHKNFSTQKITLQLKIATYAMTFLFFS